MNVVSFDDIMKMKKGELPTPICVGFFEFRSDALTVPDNAVSRWLWMLYHKYVKRDVYDGRHKPVRWSIKFRIPYYDYGCPICLAGGGGRLSEEQVEKYLSSNQSIIGENDES